jgi:septal ring factor EnvC (AmiA/AmiB activator)
MPEPHIPTDPPISPEPVREPAAPSIVVASPRREPIVCEFCECTLTPAGDALKVSEKAKQLRDIDRTITKLKHRIADLETELATAQSEASDLRRELSERTPTQRDWTL